MSIITIAHGAMSARIDPHGAQLLQLADNGHDLLWTPNAMVWDGTAQLMFPVISRTHDDTIRIDGRSLPMPMHGFAKDRMFEVIAQTPDACTLRLSSSPDSMACYPYPFRLELTFSLSDSGLALAAQIANLGDTTMPASFGFHPGFCWPLTPHHAKSDHRLSFAGVTELTYTRPQDRLIGPKRDHITLHDGTLALDEAMFAASGMVFLDSSCRSIRFHTKDERASVEIAFPAMGQFILWMRPGSNFLCIEPCLGYADPVGFAGDFIDKPGMALIAPGDTLRLPITITSTRQ